MALRPRLTTGLPLSGSSMKRPLSRLAVTSCIGERPGKFRKVLAILAWENYPALWYQRSSDKHAAAEESDRSSGNRRLVVTRAIRCVQKVTKVLSYY